MDNECNVIAARCGQALVTETRIGQRDRVIVLIVAAFSNFPPCATYVLTYLISEFTTLLRDAHSLLYFLLARHAHIILNAAPCAFLFFCSFSCLEFDFFCLWKTKEISVFGVYFEKNSVYVEIPLVSYHVYAGRTQCI